MKMHEAIKTGFIEIGVYPNAPKSSRKLRPISDARKREYSLKIRAKQARWGRYAYKVPPKGGIQKGIPARRVGSGYQPWW